MEKLLDKQGRLQEQIDHLGLWELDRKLDIAMDALRLPPGDADVTTLSGGERRRVALCRLLLAAAGHAAARRADQPSRRRERCLARALSRTSSRVPSWRSRTTGTSWTTWRSGSSSSIAAPGSLGGQLLQLAGAEAEAARAGGEAGLGPAAHPGARTRVGADVAEGAPGQEQGAYHARTRSCVPRRSARARAASRS